MDYTVVTLAERPELRSQVLALHKSLLPPYASMYAMDNPYAQKFLDYFPEYQLVLCDGEEHILGFGNTVPLTWDGTEQGLPEGWDTGFQQSFSEYERGVQPTALMATGICVTPRVRGQALSSQILQEMRHLAITHALPHVIAPVRPTLKERYPLIAMEDYAFWTREDGLPFDPWMRVHARLGATILKIAHSSTVVSGTIEEWEQWAGMRMPQSGSYLVPETLVPVTISYERNEGRYEEPNVWMIHAVPVQSRSTQYTDS